MCMCLYRDEDSCVDMVLLKLLIDGYTSARSVTTLLIKLKAGLVGPLSDHHTKLLLFPGLHRQAPSKISSSMCIWKSISFNSCGQWKSFLVVVLIGCITLVSTHKGFQWINRGFFWKQHLSQTLVDDKVVNVSFTYQCGKLFKINVNSIKCNNHT